MKKVILALLLVVAPVLAPANAGAAPFGLTSFAPPVPEPPVDCRDSVQAYAKTGQPVHAWLVRVVGVGMPARAARAFITFDDDDGTEEKDIRFDRDHPLNTSATVNGQRVIIFVSITDADNVVTLCHKTIYFNHP